MPQHYDPAKAVNNPHHKIKPGQVSSAYTVEALRGRLPAEFHLDPAIPRYLKAPNPISRLRYDKLESPGKFARPPFKPVGIPQRLPQSRQPNTYDNDVATGLLRKNGDGYTINIHDIFKDNLLTTPDKLNKSLEVARLLENSIGEHRRAAAKEYSMFGINPFKGIKTTNLTHPIVLGRLPLTVTVPEGSNHYMATGELPIVQSATIPGTRKSLLGEDIDIPTQEPMSYYYYGDESNAPHIGIGSRVPSSVWNFNKGRAYQLGYNDHPINSKAWGEDPLFLQTTGTIRHEGIHAQQNTPAPGPDSNGPTENNLRKVYNTDRQHATYANDEYWEASRAHRMLKDTYARHLINSDLDPKEIERRVQDPEEFLSFMDKVYNGGKGAGFSFPEGSIPAGLEEEVYRAANGFRPIVGEITGQTDQYNNWLLKDPIRVLDKHKFHTPEAESHKFLDSLLKGKLPTPPKVRKSLFYKLHPQVRNERGIDSTKPIA
jgi:hypothetical protein